MRDIICHHDPANCNRLWSNSKNMRTARMFRRSIRDRCEVRETAQKQVAILILIRKGMETKHAKESKFRAFLVLGLHTDVVNPGRCIRQNHRLSATPPERFVS